MPSFQKLFMEAKGNPIHYKGQELVLADRFPVSNGDILKLSIEKTNSEYVQGFSIGITGTCKIHDKVWEQGKKIKMIFWENSTDLDPKNIEMTVFTTTGFVWVQNVWRNETPEKKYLEENFYLAKQLVDSGHHGAAMIVEEIKNGRRYRCNDGHPDENFDDIVFTVQKLN